MKRGIVYGKSDATASEPDEDGLNVEDWATTIYHTMGIVADKELMAPGDRPIEIVDGGKVRKELWPKRMSQACCANGATPAWQLPPTL